MNSEALDLEFEDRRVQARDCPECGRRYEFVTAFLLHEGEAFALYYASCNGHFEARQANVDLIIGEWGGGNPTDHMTFGFILKPEGAMVVDAPATLSQAAAIMGQLLPRKQALAHPRIDQAWHVVDFIYLNDPSVAAELAGSSERHWLFDQPPTAHVLTQKSVLDGAPILSVAHGADGRGWRFLDGSSESKAEDERDVRLADVVRLDPGLAGIADLPTGWSASRRKPGAKWARKAQA